MGGVLKKRNIFNPHLMTIRDGEPKKMEKSNGHLMTTREVQKLEKFIHHLLTIRKGSKKIVKNLTTI